VDSRRAEDDSPFSNVHSERVRGSVSVAMGCMVLPEARTSRRRDDGAGVTSKNSDGYGESGCVFCFPITLAKDFFCMD